MCVDAQHYPNGQYVGHDEPSLEFKSGIPGSGNDMTYTMTLPRDPKTQPNASGAGGTTWNFQLRPTFWFGLTLCDSQSAPEFTTKCTPDSDKNNLVGSNPNSPNYIGKHPGNAFMELQFYGPGSVPQFEGFGCTATQYCAAMTIDSCVSNQNTGVDNTSACNNYILGGVEPINWAYITKSGVSQGPANPLFTGTFANPNFTAVNPNPAEDLFMSPGDTIRIHLHDTPAGLRADLTDLTTGQHGSMTASIANGFGHILYTPNSSTCQEAPYAFHPEYSTANPRGNTWSLTPTTSPCPTRSATSRTAWRSTRPPATAPLRRPGRDHRGLGRHRLPSWYRLVAGDDQRVHRLGRGLGRAGLPAGLARHEPEPGRGPGPAPVTPVLFTSPLTRGKNYSTVAFETDLPGIEVKGAQANPPFCDPNTGANCVNPPNGAAFYPFFSTTFRPGECTWQEGGKYIPGTVNDFGGSSTAEFGPLLKVLFPEPGFTQANQFVDFNSGDLRNPCRAG